MEKQCYDVLSIINKPVEIQREFTLAMCTFIKTYNFSHNLIFSCISPLLPHEREKENERPYE